MEIYELSEKTIGTIMNGLVERIETLKKGIEGINGLTMG